MKSESVSLFEDANNSYVNQLPDYLHDDYEALLEEQRKDHEPLRLPDDNTPVSLFTKAELKIGQRISRFPLVFLAIGPDLQLFKNKFLFGLGVETVYFF